ncbi:hypothetical protein HFO60_11605 [Rhizobium leguminosarum]|uniref:hypothetical protein n=1 Tax=Rhizobium leguminosarum TaxID=384 RepID=UPI001C966267|nr:hypothetical protein [Rhizobium leguminosarum]MBY5540672.1 hypothetical protein [Rhizobium leguminosarum]MBY5618747.1 hypothetical protein [Rhizobium leguminosarum]MBY5673406.1 hypothetical protein [Rhizobium leguminosarum]MBY5686895.1 hypothetical protein [Rhizobium leguminosarum]MBY5707681.1 hypothetical protein [Rhizobium leguminosarum]
MSLYPMEPAAIVIEVKGYGATGSTMTDIISELDAIIDAMSRGTYLLFRRTNDKKPAFRPEEDRPSNRLDHQYLGIVS